MIMLILALFFYSSLTYYAVVAIRFYFDDYHHEKREFLLDMIPFRLWVLWAINEFSLKKAWKITQQKWIELGD